jgi:Raf kinase inhibitor-like YbhB/YbcL family protein
MQFLLNAFGACCRLMKCYNRYRILILTVDKDSSWREGVLFNLIPSMVRNDEDCSGAAAIKHIILYFAILVIFSSTLSACTKEVPESQKEVDMTISLSSIVFKDGNQIPIKYTCDGQDISPPLIWDEPPQKTQVLALIVDDPDAPGGVFTHWVLFNIPTNIRQLEEGVPAQERLQNGALQGKNDFGRIGYGGPCPPRGPEHRYRYTIYMLDAPLDLKPGASKKQLLDAMKEHIIAQGQLTGTYQR